MAISRRFKRYDEAMRWIAKNERPDGYWKLNFSGQYIVVTFKLYAAK